MHNRYRRVDNAHASLVQLPQPPLDNNASKCLDRMRIWVSEPTLHMIQHCRFCRMSHLLRNREIGSQMSSSAETSYRWLFLNIGIRLFLCRHVVTYRRYFLVASVESQSAFLMKYIILLSYSRVICPLLYEYTVYPRNLQLKLECEVFHEIHHVTSRIRSEGLTISSQRWETPGSIHTSTIQIHDIYGAIWEQILSLAAICAAGWFSCMVVPESIV